MTYNKLYGHWGEDCDLDWPLAFDQWVNEEHDVEAARHRLASRSVVQFSSENIQSGARTSTESLTVIPSLEALEVRDPERSGSDGATAGVMGRLRTVGRRTQRQLFPAGGVRDSGRLGDYFLGRFTRVPPDRRFVAKFFRNPRLVSSQLRDWQVLQHSGLFDADYYLAQNSDVAAAGVEPLWHYVQAGESEGRRPNPFFDPSFYRMRVPEVSDNDGNLLHHFFVRGGFEGRAPSEEFDPSYYLGLHPDVAASRQNPLSHYLAVGRIEGRSARLVG
jgi:hypothetical protein